MWNRPPPHHHETKQSYSTQNSKPLKRLNTASLADDKIEKSLADAIENCLKSTLLIESNIDKSWECFKEAIHSTALSIIGPRERKHQDWFDDNTTDIRKLLDEKHKFHKLYLNTQTPIALKNNLQTSVKCANTVKPNARYLAKQESGNKTGIC
ncbi:cytochrome P450 2D20 [Biomphalaria glabrata]|nr:cytochrome P450 2D20 [Biomphalaria glabrata]